MKTMKQVFLSLLVTGWVVVSATAAGFRDVEIVESLGTGEELGSTLQVEYTVTPGKSASKRVLTQAKKKAFEAGMTRIAIVGIEASGEETIYSRGINPEMATRLWASLDGAPTYAWSGPRRAPMSPKRVSVRLTVRDVLSGSGT